MFTMEMAYDFFWNDKNTFYASTHQMPLYPGTGALNETGAFNNIVNAPFVAVIAAINFKRL